MKRITPYLKISLSLASYGSYCNHNVSFTAVEAAIHSASAVDAETVTD